jgi:hypothetical protein
MKRRIVFLAFFSSILAMLSALLIPDKESSAFPVFARKYEQPCAKCHTPVPKLNDFGNRFRDNGYQMKGLEDGLADKDIPTNLSSAFWPAAFRASVGYTYKTVDDMAVGGSPTEPVTSPTNPLDRASTSGVEFFGVKLLAGGTTARDVSFLLSFFDLENGNFRPQSIWVRLDNIGGSSLANLKLGKFELDLPFSEQRSPTFFIPYVPYHYTPGTPYIPEIGLLRTNFRPPFEYGNKDTFDLADRDNPGGVELMGHKEWAPGRNFRYAMTGLLTENIDIGGRAPGFYGHVTQSLGGGGITSGHRIGIYGLWAQAPTQDRFGLIGTGEANHPFFRLGGDLSTNFALGAIGKLNLFGVYTYGEDSRHLISPLPTTITGTIQSAKWHGWFVEGNLVKPPYAYVLRYDGVRNFQQGVSTVPDDFNDVDSGTIAIRRFLFTPVIAATVIHADYSITKTQRTALDGSDQTLQVAFIGFDFLF